MDEVAFVPEELFVVFQPLLMVDGSWMFLASSPPEDPSHWFNQLSSSTSSSYRNVSFENVCAACLQLPQEEWTKCPHVKQKSSLMKDKARFDDLNTNLNIGDKKKLVRENAGVITNINQCVFTPRDLDVLFDPNKRTVGFAGVDMFMFAIDPSYNGSNDTAFLVLARVQGYYSIVWADFRETVRDLMKVVTTNIREFHNKIRKTAAIPIVVAIESISRIDGNVLAKWIAGESDDAFQNIHVITDESNMRNSKGTGLEGVRLDRSRKIQMVTKLEILLEEGNVKIHKNFSTAHKEGPDHVLKEMKHQLGGFRGLGDGYSLKMNGGKHAELSGKKGLKNDDLALVLMMSLWWWKRFRTHSAYASQRELIELKIV